MRRVRRRTVLLAGAAALIAAGLGSFYLPLPRGTLNPRAVISLRLTDRNGALLREVLSDEGGRCRWVGLADISPFLLRATVASEDKSFFAHSGVNLAAVVTVAYEVNLTWDAPETSPDPVVGYEVFRAPGDSTMYSQINIDPVTVTAFTDDAVVEGTYDYVVESVDAAGINSAPSNVAQVPVP